MNGPFVVAQANTGGASATPVQVLKLIKPQAGHTDILHASFTGAVKVDFTAIANEKITLFHDSKNQSLHVIFADGSQIIIEPFFDSTGTVLANLLFEMGPNQIFDGIQFAQQFPISEDQSVLPAAGDAAVVSGADFHDPAVDPLGPATPLDLLPPEELPGLAFTNTATPFLETDQIPIQVAGKIVGIVEEEENRQIIENGDGEARINTFSLVSGGYKIGGVFFSSQGNEDTNDVASPADPPPFEDPNATPNDTDNTNGGGGPFQDLVTRVFTSDASNSLATLFTGGDPPLNFHIDSTITGQTVVDSDGNPVTSNGEALVYGPVITLAGETIVSAGNGASGSVFEVHIFDDGSWEFDLFGKLDHPDATQDPGSILNGALEETLFLDLTKLVEVTDGTGTVVHLSGANIFDVGVIDDTPNIECVTPDPCAVVVHDETPGVQFFDDDTTNPSVVALFAGVANKGNDPDVPDGQKVDGAIGFAQSNGALISAFGSFGADGPLDLNNDFIPDAGAIVFSLTLNGPSGSVDSGIQTTEGREIFLFQEGDLIVGRYDTAGGEVDSDDPAAFAIAIDPVTGQVSVAQWVSLHHNSPDVGHDIDEFVSLEEGTVNATITITDDDGDSASKSADISSQIQFEDDGPTLCVTTGSGTVSHDETPGSTNTAQNPEPPATDISGSTNVTFNGGTHSVFSLFSSVVNKGNDPDVGDDHGAIGYAQGQGAFVNVLANFGADGPKDSDHNGVADTDATVYALHLPGGNGTWSGLYTTEGEKIYLFEENGLIVGRIDADNDLAEDSVPGHFNTFDQHDDDDAAAFAITIDPQTGQIYVAQYLSLKHFSSPDASGDISEPDFLASGTLQVSVTITDGDGDTVTKSADISGEISFRDDGPTVDVKLDHHFHVIHDEEPGVQNGGEDDDITFNSLPSEVRATFDGVANKGFDPDLSSPPEPSDQHNHSAIGFAISEDSAVDFNTLNYGADGPKDTNHNGHADSDAITYALKLSSEGLYSGLQTTDGQSIFLFTEGDAIVGRVGGANGAAAIAITIDDDGHVATAQWLSLKHPDIDQTDDDDIVKLDIASGTLTIAVTITDGDGDTATASTGDISDGIQFEDDGPSAKSNDKVQLEDDDLPFPGSPGGNAPGIDGGPGDDSAPQNATGTLGHDYGADGPGSITLLSNVGLPSGLGFSVHSNDGTTLIIQQNQADYGTVDVLRIQINNTTGAYTVTQLHAIDHPTDNQENNVEFTINYQITDGDGDHANGSLKINIDDDSPDPDFHLASGSIIHDETPGVDGDANDVAASPTLDALFSAVTPIVQDTDVPHPGGEPAIGYAQSSGAIVSVTPNYGADGPGSTVYTLDVSSAGVSSGLFTTDGHEIFLFKVNSQLIVGRYDGADAGTSVGTGDPAAFAIHIDPTTGILTVAQYQSIKHDDRGDNDESNDNGNNANDALPDDPLTVQQVINDSALKVTVTVTDHDGDAVSQTFNIGDQINFQDDGPSSASLSITAGTLIHDETPGVDAGSDDVSPSGTLDNLFSGVVNKGNDPDVADIPGDNVIGYARDTFTISASVTYGADGPGANSPQYSLAIPQEDVFSGLQTTEGLNIRLQNENGIIVGRVDTDGNGSVSTSDPAAFAIRVDASTGQLTLVQYLSIKHDDKGDNDEANDNGTNGNDASPDDTPDPVQQFLATGTLSLVATFTDGDGDPIQASTDISSRVIFEDDGPSSASLSITSGTLIHDETPGNDAGSDDITQTVALDTLFSGVANKGNDPDVTDPVSGTPVIGYARDTFTISQSVTYGADGKAAGSPQYSLAISATNVLSGLKVTDGHDIRLVKEGDIIVGRVDSDGDGSVTDGDAGDKAAFAIAVDPSTGQLTVVQYLSIKHDDKGDNDEANDNGTNGNDASPDDTPDPVQQFLATGTVSLVATFTDGDGDPIQASADISNRIIFEDDGPTVVVSGSATINLDESIVNPVTTSQEGGTVPAGADDTALTQQNGVNPIGHTTQSVSGNFLFSLGADGGTADYSLRLKHTVEQVPQIVTTLQTNLFATQPAPGGNPDPNSGDSDPFTPYADNGRIYLIQVDATHIEGHVGNSLSDPLALKISIDNTGLVTVDQYLALYHDGADNLFDGDGNNFDAAIDAISSLANGVVAVLTATDGDGDQAAAELPLNLHVEDDGPVVASATTVETILDDEGQTTAVSVGPDANGIAGGPGDDAGVLTTISGNLAFNAGTDGLKSVVAGFGQRTAPLQAIHVDPVTGHGEAMPVVTGWEPDGAGGGTFRGWMDITGGTAGVYDAGTDDLVFTMTVHADGSYTLNLYAPLAHPFHDADSANNGPEIEWEDNVSLTFNYVVTDGDNDTASSTITFNVDDDTPDVPVPPDAITVSGNPAIDSPPGKLNFEPGADGWGKGSFEGNVAPDGLTSGGQAIHYYVDPAHPEVLIGYIGATSPGDLGYNSANTIFKVTLNLGDDTIDGNPNDGIGGSWTFDLIGTLDGLSTEQLTVGGSSFGSGPQPYQILSTGSGGTGEQLSVASGWQTDGTFNEATWLATGASTGVSIASINGSTGGWGVDNNNFTTGEFLRFDFGSLADFDGAGGYTPPAASLPNVNQATFAFPFYSASDDISYVAHFSNGTIASATLADPTAGLVINAPAGLFIDYVEFYAHDANGSGKVDLQSVGAQVQGNDLHLSFNATLTDGDGDAEQVALAATVHSQTPPLNQDGQAYALVEEEQLGHIDQPAFLASFVGNEDGDEGPLAPVNADGDVDPNFNITTAQKLAGGFAVFGGSGDIDGHFDNAFQDDIVQFVGGGNVTAHGHNVRFDVIDSDSLRGYEDVDGNGDFNGADRIIFTMELHNGGTTPTYDFFLWDNIDHHTVPAADDRENTRLLDLDGIVIATSTGTPDKALDAKIEIIDDIPVAQNNLVTVQQGTSTASYNLLLILDLSLSMDQDVGGGQTRLEVAQAALNNLIDAYAGLSNNVTIQIETFNSTGTLWPTIYTTGGDAANNLAAAKAFINGFDSGDLVAETDYDDAVVTGATAVNSWTPGNASLLNLVYFVSDGLPQPGGADTEISDAEENTWEAALAAKNAQAFAVGIDLGGSPDTQHLQDVAFPDTNVFLTSSADLSSILVDTVVPAFTSGNVLANDSFGADGPLNGPGKGIVSITVSDSLADPGDPHTYSYNAGANQILRDGSFFANGSTLDVDTVPGGHLTFHFTTGGGFNAGDYAYTSPDSVGAGLTETFHYVIADGDGDKTGADLQITVEPAENIAPTLALHGSDFVLDQFNSVAYNNNDGSVDWASNWTEVGDNNIASSGDFQVSTSGNDHLQFNNSVDNGDYISRNVNLSGAESAVLSFDYSTTNLGAGGRVLHVQAWNGGSWQELGTISGSGTFSQVLTPAETILNGGIRFLVEGNWDPSGSSNDASASIDNVMISYTLASPITDFATTYVENGTGVSIVNVASLITDADSPNMQSAHIVLTNEQAGDFLAINGTHVHNGDVGTVNGINYTVTDNGSQVTIDLAGLHTKADYQTAINDITFASDSENPSTTDRTITATVTDDHGNVSNTAITTVHVDAVDDAPDAVNDSVFTNVNGGASSFLIPEWALLLNDTDLDDTLDITATSGVNDLTSASLATNPGNVTVVNNDGDGGSFTYTATGGALTDNATVSVNVDASGTLSGDDNANIIIGSSASQTIDGNGGRDVMFGRGGNDTFDYNSTADSGNTINTADIIADFDTANDVIDLTDIDSVPGGGDQNFGTQGGFSQNAGLVAHGVTWHQSGADTIVTADTDGNTATTEMMIILTGVNANNLTSGNFTG